MKHYADPQSLETPMRRGEGYLYFMATLQIAAGALSVLFSLLALLRYASVGEASLLNPVVVADAFDGLGAGNLNSIIAGYVGFQVTYGWVMGLLLIIAGVCCLKRREKPIVAAAAALNLFNFPHGTTVGIMMLHGLTRPGISHAFRDRKRTTRQD